MNAYLGFAIAFGLSLSPLPSQAASDVPRGFHSTSTSPISNIDLTGRYTVTPPDPQTGNIGLEVSRHAWDTYYFEWRTNNGQVSDTIVYVDGTLHKFVDTEETKYTEIGRNNAEGIEYTVVYQSTSSPKQDYRLEASYKLDAQGDLLWHGEYYDAKNQRTQVLDKVYKKTL